MTRTIRVRKSAMTASFGKDEKTKEAVTNA
jgi:hypothetical protein